MATGKASAVAEDLGDKLLGGNTVTIVDIHPDELLEGQGIDIPSDLGAPVVSTGVRATQSVPKGSVVKIVDVHSEDAYYSDRSNIIGKTCTLGDDSSFKDGEWHGGSVECGTDSYYFYKAAYQVK